MKLSIFYLNQIYKRNQLLLELEAKENLAISDSLVAINKMIVLIWKGMLSSVLNNRVNYSKDMATELTMKYIRKQIELLK